MFINKFDYYCYNVVMRLYSIIGLIIVCNYIPMPKDTPYIPVNREAMPLLHFCAHLFFHAPSYTFILYSRYTPMNSCYTEHFFYLYPCHDSVPLLFPASHTLQLCPASRLHVCHPPVGSAVQ